MSLVHPVKIELARRGLTQRRFARQVGVSAGTLNGVLNGHLAPWPALRTRIANAFDLPEDELFPEATS